MDSPVWGCITGAQKCSHGQGLACEVWMEMALSAACEYSRGVSSAIRGERRGSPCGCSSGVVGMSLGSTVGATVGRGWALGAVVGAVAGISGGVLRRVCRWWTRGAVRVISGAVGLDDVGVVRSLAPFEGSHGRDVGSRSVSGGGFPVNF